MVVLSLCIIALAVVVATLGWIVWEQRDEIAWLHRRVTDLEYPAPNMTEVKT